MNLKGKHIVLGISGSIAAYKACPLIRLFIKAGAEVQVHNTSRKGIHNSGDIVGLDVQTCHW